MVELSEKRQPDAFEVRFAFTTDENQKLIINYTTGLLLGDEQPLYGAIKAENHSQSSANVLVRINGRLLP